MQKKKGIVIYFNYKPIDLDEAQEIQEFKKMLEILKEVAEMACDFRDFLNVIFYDIGRRERQDFDFRDPEITTDAYVERMRLRDYRRYTMEAVCYLLQNMFYSADFGREAAMIEGGRSISEGRGEFLKRKIKEIWISLYAIRYIEDMVKRRSDIFSYGDFFLLKNMRELIAGPLRFLFLTFCEYWLPGSSIHPPAMATEGYKLNAIRHP